MLKGLQEKKNRIVELALVSGNHFVELFTTLVITKLISVYLTKEEYGFYALILSIFTLVSILPFTSLHTAIERYVIEYKRNQSFEKKFVSLISIHSVFFFAYFLILPFISSHLSNDWRNILALLIFFIIARIYKALIVCIWNVERKRKIMLFARLVDMLIQIGIIILFISRFKLTVNIALVASIFGNTFTILVFIFSYRKLFTYENLNFKIFGAVFSDILRYSLPLILWGVFLWAQNMVGRWYLEFFLNKTNVANYSIMTSLALIPGTAIIALVGQFVVPIVYTNESDNPGYISIINKKIFLISVVFWILVIIITYFFKDILIQVFLDKKYVDISWSLPILMIGTAIYSIGQVTIYEIYYYKKPNLLIAANILPGLFSVIFGYFIIKSHGYAGAIFTNVASYIISGLLTIFIVLRFGKTNKLSLNN
ncbi:oligosaccharide flippase family protein [Macellibacteroides fermentans]|uniref:oligosaccharide flippase family protein n=1 Tax=Macellibacteroides fermentans TaxID=879969 RepID=UPI00352CB41C